MEDYEPDPKGNGGKTDQYIWTQTLEVNIELMEEFRNVYLCGFKCHEKTNQHYNYM